MNTTPPRNYSLDNGAPIGWHNTGQLRYSRAQVRETPNDAHAHTHTPPRALVILALWLADKLGK